MSVSPATSVSWIAGLLPVRSYPSSVPPSDSPAGAGAGRRVRLPEAAGRGSKAGPRAAGTGRSSAPVPAPSSPPSPPPPRPCRPCR
eukprot:tig00001065_g6734.t1